MKTSSNTSIKAVKSAQGKAVKSSLKGVARGRKGWIIPSAGVTGVFRLTLFMNALTKFQTNYPIKHVSFMLLLKLLIKPGSTCTAILPDHNGRGFQTCYDSLQRLVNCGLLMRIDNRYYPTDLAYRELKELL